MTDLVSRVIAILEQEFDARQGGAALHADSELSSLGLSSLNLVKLIVRLESAFDIEFADEALDLTRLGRVRDLAQYIQQRGSGAA